MPTNQSVYDEMCEVYRDYLWHKLVRVVRCKDCKHYKEFEGEMECWARPMMFPREPNDFCSMGERREDAEVHNQP